jgi:hypothetical protein
VEDIIEEDTVIGIEVVGIMVIEDITVEIILIVKHGEI